MNKFEQVSSLGYQMSVPGSEGLMSKENGAKGVPNCEVQCIMGNGHMDVPSSGQADRHTNRELKTFPFCNFVDER